MSARPLLRAAVRPLATSRVSRLGLLLVLAAVAFRVWALSRSWFYFDDLAFLSAGMNDPLDWDFVSRVYAGHVMPAGWLVIKALATWAPYRWPVWAGVLVLMQVVAAIGMLRLLRSMFGETRVVLALLAGYLFYIFTVPAGVWFAAGINQLPLQIALAFGLHAHLEYLRTGRWRPLVVTLAWTLFGLAFYEKTFILFGVYALVALCWFATGTLGDRAVGLWKRYRSGVVAHGVLAVAYLVIYLRVGVAFGSDQPSAQLMSSVAYRLIAVAFSTGAIGGPFEWRAMSANALAGPTDLISLGSWVALGSLVWYAATTRTISRRAWTLIAFTLLANVYLLSSARANLVGADIGLEYRYQTESAAILVLAAGLAFLPLVGAVEVNQLRPGADVDKERPAVIKVLTVAVVAAAVVSTLGYVQNWQHSNPTRPYFDNLKASLARSPVTPVPLVDLSLPQNLLWAFGYPENTYSHVFRHLADQMTFPETAVDDLFVLDDTGTVRPVTIPPARTMIGGTGCGYILGHSPTTIPLDGPVIGGGWWIAMDYAAPEPFTVRIGLGTSSTTMELPAGMHTAYFRADGSFSEVMLGNSAPGTGACVTKLVLGDPGAQQ